MPELISNIYAVLEKQWPIIAGAATLLSGWIAWRYVEIKAQLADETSRKQLVSLLTEETSWFERYRRRLFRLNKRWLAFFGRPWSLRAFDRCLAIAMVYPIALFLLAWMAGGPATIGDLAILADIPPGWPRVGRGLLAATALILVFYILTDLLKNDRDSLVFRLVVWLIPARRRDGILQSAAGRAIIALVAVAVAVAGAVAFSVAGAGTLAGALAGAGAVAVAFSVAGAGAFAVGFAVAFAFAFADAGAGVGAVGAKVTLFFITFIFILPYVNAFFDYLSWAATRLFLLKASNAENNWSGRWTILWMLLSDWFIACLCLAGLAMAMAMALDIMNMLSVWLKAPIYDWRAQLKIAVEAPFSAGLSVTGMLVSTLVPTAIHLFMGAYGMAARATPELRTFADTTMRQLLSVRDQQWAARHLIWREFKGITAGLAATAFVAGPFLLLYLWHVPFARLLAWLACWATQWTGMGGCGWLATPPLPYNLPVPV